MVEDYAVVLDFLTRGKSSSFKSEPLAQVMGTETFTLLEVVPRDNVVLRAGEKVYVGKEVRDKIDHIKKRLQFKELTSTAAMELPTAIKNVVVENKARFVDFYNNARPISLKLHQLQLLPGVGKKHLLAFLKEREQTLFDSLDQLSDRVPMFPNPVQVIVKRVLEELEGFETKYYLFTRPPAVEKPRFPKRF
jgi:putative nucleotide binding protein